MPTTTTGVATEFINFTRASNATVTDSNGLIEWAPHNLLLASEQFDASQWPKNAITVTANSVTAPNGTTTADTMLDTAVNIIHYTGQYITSPPPAGLTFTVSAFCKANTLNYVTLGISDISVGNLYAVAVFNLSNGTVATSGASGTGYSVAGTPTITSAGGGWYLCTVTAVAGTSVSFLNALISLNKTGIISPTAGGSESYLGNGSGIYIWGAHVYRSDLGMQANTSAYPMYNPTTPKNLLGFTETFSDSSWVKAGLLAFGSGSVANVAVGPNGLQTADLLVEDTGTSSHNINRSFTCVSNTPYTWSAYVKPAGRSIVRLVNQATAVIYQVEFTLSGSGTSANISGSGTATITALSDGWYRISATATATAGSTGYWQLNLCNSANITSYTGDGISGIYLWGAQLSDSASLDPYSPNHFAAPSAAAYYGPRRDFDPVTLACKGLLVEEQRANLLTYSAQFDDAAWSKNGAASITADTTVAPDGTSTSDTLTGASGDPSVGTTDTVSRSPVVSSSTAYTASLYVKGIVGTTIKLVLRDGSTGTIASVTGTLTSSWQRISCTLTSGAATTGFSLRIGGTNGTVAIWGAQLEAGSFATSYIPTTTASATRSADVAQVSTAAFPYSSTESTLVANCTLLGSSSSSGVIAALQLAASPGGLLLLRSSNSLATVAWVDASFAALGTADTTNQQKLALAYNGTANGSVRNGGTVSSVGTTISGPATKLAMGCDFNNSSQLNGHIRQITYVPRRLSNAELQARTV